MQIFFAIIAITGFVIKQKYIYAENNESANTDVDDLDIFKLAEHASGHAYQNGLHNKTFVALIEIVLTDGSKRACTGTVIHDNVVITAAHCLGKTQNKFILPELSASFVIIGTEEMYDFGKEQYLPIERIIGHHRYKGWTADIALIYTFADMVLEQPANTIPLADDEISIPVNSNVTVFSWGHCKDSDFQKERTSNIENWTSTKTDLEALRLRANNPIPDSEEIFPSKTKNVISKMSGLYSKARKNLKSDNRKINNTNTRGKRYKKYETTERNKVIKSLHELHATSDQYTDEDSLMADSKIKIRHKLVQEAKKQYGSVFKNFRRSMKHHKNKLSVETFKFVDMKTCEEMMKKALPEKYPLKNPNEYVCYSNDDRFVTDEDAGAPAVVDGQLVAVTVGGVECDNEYVSVGIKVSCFCQWIADNLPNGGMHFKCCDNCCEHQKPPQSYEDNKEETETRYRKKKRKRRI